MRIIVGADIVPTQNNYDLFKSGNVEALVGDKIKEQLASADYRIFNLEGAFVGNDTPIQKAGPNIGFPTDCVAGMNALGVNLLGLSNNHILDHGHEGLATTLKTLDNAGIAHVGAGFAKDEAKKTFYFEKDGIKVGVYACCEHEFSWIEDYGFGANGFDALESLDDIVQAKNNCDYLIVLYHGGKEHYRYPSPYLKKVCRKIVEKGANIVLCQHSHCVGAEEDYCGGKIIYGQGNFVFAKNYANISTWGEGFLVSIDLTKSGVEYNYIPFNKTDVGVVFDETGEILKGLKERSEQIKQAGFIENAFEKMAEESVVRRYVTHMIGKVPTEEDLNKVGLQLFHCAECEVHRECLLTGLRKRLGLGKYGEFKK